MARIICLANSYKGGGKRCIAGIDMETRKWVRPFNNKGYEGAIGNERLIKGNEPRVLDILDIPIGGESENYGCQPENRILLPGRWKKIGTISPEDILKYVDEDPLLLHNDDKKVDPEYFTSIQKKQWKSLQLIQARDVRFGKNPWNKWKCYFSYYHHCYELSITDAEVRDHLNAGGKIARKCFLTISMGGPYDRDNSGKKFCWKMVAGVVEL